MLRRSPRIVVVHRRPYRILVPKSDESSPKTSRGKTDFSRYKDAHEEVKAGDSLRKVTNKHMELTTVVSCDIYESYMHRVLIFREQIRIKVDSMHQL
ncbi:hypothetical protein EVAR_75945_1 [Eumeta japonica]|uniref:Uncharacterized protein n=1 Tax=Eumeta variegata TaxID=151549 RepID=A0A4C1UW64_EUMVA|nr:hypothetical protein EVAR_75945_1 [Eumeta japonica]